MHLEWKTCLRVGVSAFLLYLAIHYWTVVSALAGTLLRAAFPLFLGGVIAYVVNILMSFYERRIRLRGQLWNRRKRPVCMLLALLTVVLAALALICLIIPQLISCFQVLLEALPGALSSLYAWLDETFNLSAWLQSQSLTAPEVPTDWNDLIQKGLNLLINGVGGAMSVLIATTSSLVGSVVTTFMSLIFAVYLLTGKERLGSQFRRLSVRLVGETRTQRALDVLRVMDRSFHSYIVGQCLEALILGALCTLGMLLLRLPYALMLGALVGITALIPIAGAYIGGGVGAVMIFSVSPMKAVVFVVFLIILQQIEGNLIYPRTVGATLGLPGIWVLAAVTVGGSTMGIVGMILFVPLTSAAYQLIGQYVRNGERKPSIEPQEVPNPPKPPEPVAAKRRKKR